ncbi:hypothetical protein Taro_007166 [Colocasia esculenta]|uniref:Uncharacterized protein n=1 Tax=Colocasia esculenta TaxID=4460 RepID=A0A843TQM1_COLES|nr:hypothetical protein [Colocasia esculenta]
MVRRCFSHGCSVSLVVTPGCSFPISWRSGMLGACVVWLWSHVVAPYFASAFVGVPTALAGKGLVIPIEPCSRGSPPLLSSGRDSLSQEFIAGRLWWWFVAPCVASSVSCERERLFRSELRVAFLQVLRLFEFIAYLTGLNSYPSGSSDPWVAARPLGSLAGGSGRSGYYSGIRALRSNEICNELIIMAVPKKATSTLLDRPCRVAIRCKLLVAGFPAGSGCELQKSVAAVAGCACYKRGCWFARAAVEFVVSLRVRLRYAVVVLAGAFRWVSQSGALVVLVEVLPGLACIVSAVLLAAECSVFVLGYRCVAPVV